MNRKLIVVQVSPYPPEPGADYHEQLACELAHSLKAPVIVLAGLNHLSLQDALDSYGVIEKHGCVVVYRAFWAPRVIERKNPGTTLRYIVASLKALAQTIRIAEKHAENIVVHFHYGPTTWSGALLGEHYPLGMLLARTRGARVAWTIHAFLTPHQLLQEARERRLPLPLALMLIAYYTLLAKIAATACHKIIVLVDCPNAPITSYLSRLLGKKKVIEQVHPPFKPLVKPKKELRNKITIACLGYIRREKGYHYLLQWLASLKNRNPSLYNRVNVIIAGGIDRKKREDLEYLKNILYIRREYKLNNVKLIIRKLNREEFHKLLAESTIVWCAYIRKYGPSGIMAWTKAYKKHTLTLRDLWGYRNNATSNVQSHVSSRISNVIKFYEFITGKIK